MVCKCYCTDSLATRMPFSRMPTSRLQFDLGMRLPWYDLDPIDDLDLRQVKQS